MMRAPLLLIALLLVAAPRASAQLKSDQERYDDNFRKYSKRFFGPGFDWTYFKAQAMAESRLDASARSYVGARGVMQLMPRTYEELRRGNSEMTLGRIEDPEWNIAAGIMYDRKMWMAWDSLQKNNERLRFMFASYNAGPGTIRRAARTAAQKNLLWYDWTSIEQVAPAVPRWRYRETLGYVRRIESNYNELKADQINPGLINRRFRAIE